MPLKNPLQNRKFYQSLAKKSHSSAGPEHVFQLALLEAIPVLVARLRPWKCCQRGFQFLHFSAKNLFVLQVLELGYTSSLIHLICRLEKIAVRQNKTILCKTPSFFAH